MTDALPQVGQGRRPPSRRPWPKLPRWLWAGGAVTVLVFAALTVWALPQLFSKASQPVYERRTPPRAAAASHDVGEVVASRERTQPVACGRVQLLVAGDDLSRELLSEALERGLCNKLARYPAELATRVVRAAERGTVISFGVFERTGDDSTTLAGPPPRVLINNRFTTGVFKGFLLPLLAHELWHAGDPDGVLAVDAREERLARTIEDTACDDPRIQASRTVARGCGDAAAITSVSSADAEARLRAAGYS